MNKARTGVFLLTLLSGVLAVQTFSPCGIGATQPSPKTGRQLFETETFGGNGRTCATCHLPETGTISPQDVQARLQKNRFDPLFLHDGSDNGRGAGISRILKDATFLVELPLLPGVSLADDPKATSVVLQRGVPSTLNTPALDNVLMSDGRQPNLVAQAAGAIRDHYQSTGHTNEQDLKLIAEFEKTDAFFSSPALRAFARGGPAPALPQGNTESEKRGRVFFEDAPFTPPSRKGVCAVCHSGPMLNQTNKFNPLPIPLGTRFLSAGVSELNPGNLPVRTFLFRKPDGTTIPVKTTDPGRALLTGDARPNAFTSLNAFKIPTLWGVRRTAPYFHDNSAKTLEDLAAHYAKFIELVTQPNPLVLSAQDQADIVAYMKLLE